jgi:type VI secretion system protein VasD
MTFNRILLAWVGLAALAMSACASHGSTDLVETRAVVTASTDVNPDISGRPSPVVVRVFQLRSDAEFLSADFFNLYSNEKTALGGSLVSREEYVMHPGERREARIGLAPDAGFIGVIAAFRDIQGAHWRALQLRPRRTFGHGFAKVPVMIALDRDALKLSLKK